MLDLQDIQTCLFTIIHNTVVNFVREFCSYKDYIQIFNKTSAAVYIPCQHMQDNLITCISIAYNYTVNMKC